MASDGGEVDTTDEFQGVAGIGRRLAYLETVDARLVVLPNRYPDGHRVPEHRHGRGQLLATRTGAVMVRTRLGRWLVPPEHAMWIPAGVDHEVEMIGEVAMRSVYVKPGAIGGLPDRICVIAPSELMNSLVAEAARQFPAGETTVRDRLVVDLLLHEIADLPERPLNLPIPRDPRLAALCREFLAAPTARPTIDQWAHRAGMSRRSFTRAFGRETGLTLSVWRQQACLMAALPRLAAGESVTAVALDLGYESVAAFTTMFRRMLGAPPRSYPGTMRAQRANASRPAAP